MNLEQIKVLIHEFESSTLSELELEIEDVKLKLKKDQPDYVEKRKPVVEKTSKESIFHEQSEEVIEDGVIVRAPLVGIFYRSSSPETSPFVTVGQHVNKGDILCIIEAMKVMNEVSAPVTGVVQKIFAENGELLGAQEPIFQIEEK